MVIQQIQATPVVQARPALQAQQEILVLMEQGQQLATLVAQEVLVPMEMSALMEIPAT
jgi:hypothetical protein